MASLGTAGLGLVAGAGLICIGQLQKARGSEILGNALTSIGGAIGAVSALSCQWESWFCFNRIAGGSPVASLTQEALLDSLRNQCLLHLPKEYSACGIPENELKEGVHFDLKVSFNPLTPQSKMDCCFTAKESFAKSCRDRVKRMPEKFSDCIVLYTEMVKKYLNPDQAALVRGIDYEDVNIVKNAGCKFKFLSKEMKEAEKSLRQVLDLEQRVLQSDSNREPFKLGLDYQYVCDGGTCAIKWSPELEKTQCELDAFDRFSACPDQFPAIKNSITVSEDGKCSFALHIAEEDQEEWLARCRPKNVNLVIQHGNS